MEVLNAAGAKAQMFVGQAKKGATGMSQKEQKDMLDRFRNDDFNVLIATSIAEEGLDIVKVDIVVFYEPVPSAIRSIQRRGRTGRQEKGRTIMLIAKDTRDEAFRWVAHNKEKKMYKILDNLKSSLSLTKRADSRLSDYATEKKQVKVFADFREKGSVTKELADLGLNVELKSLDVGDYLCSSRVAVELKEVEDFVNSIVDGRLLSQISAMKRVYEKPIVIIQGEADIYSVRKVHANAIRGMLASIAIDFSVPIIRTKDYRETAGFIFSIAKREQEKNFEDIQMRSDKPLTLMEQQEFIVASLPGVEATIAKNLLKELKSVKNIVNASEAELKKAEFIGEKKAKEIRRVLDSEYKSD